MSAILFQLQALRKLTCREWVTTEQLLAVAAALKEAAAEADRALTNCLEAEAADAWQKGDWL
jgi:hypothetical protein